MKLLANIVLGVILFAAVTWVAKASTITAVSDGNWATNGTWSCGCQPTNADNITIPAGRVVTVTSSLTLILGPKIKITIAGSLILNNATFTVDSNDVILISSGGTITGAGLLGGNVISGSTTIPVASGTSLSGPSSITGGVLPIKLASFSGVADKEFITINWTSTSEENFDYYNVLKSVDGIDFSSIGSVKGKKIEATKQDYYFEDRNPSNGKSYYQLEAVDLDGSSEFFDIIMIEFAAALEDNISVYPNPVSGGKLNIKFNAAPEHNHELFLYDSRGFLVFRKSLPNESMLSSCILPSNLERGIYFVVVRSSSVNFRTAVYIE